MKIKYYIITAILALSLFLIIGIPAAPVINAVKDQIPQVKIQNVSGTLWQGSAQQVTVLSKYVFKNVNWSVCIAYIFTGNACIEIDASYNKNPLSGQFMVNMNQAVQGNNIKTTMTAQALTQLAPLPMGEIAGDFVVDLSSVNWQPGQLPSANGIIKWNNASLTISEMAKLGDITITLSDSDESLVNAEISNTGGQLSIAGQASIAENTDYNLDLKFIPNKNASKNLKDNLGFFSQHQSNGDFIFKNNGNLKKRGLL